MLVDSHCHLDQIDLSNKEGGLASVIADAKSRGVQRILGVAVDLNSSIYLSELSQSYSCLMTSVGVHPLHKSDDNLVSVDDLVSLTELPGVVAIGETGLDKFYSSATFEWQRESFINHLQASDISGKPVIIHSRDAVDETLELLAEFKPSPRGVIHCFTESWEMAKAAIELGFYISFSGIITFNNASDSRVVASKIPLDRLLIETDSPWLTPAPHRGKNNEPKYVLEVAQCLANLHGLHLEELAEITTQNFDRLFKTKD